MNNCSDEKSNVKFLYRYQEIPSSANLKYLKNLLVHNIFYFSSPEKFNDPFDSKVYFGDSNEGDFQKYYTMSEKYKNPEDSDDETKAKVKKLLKEEKHKDPKWIKCFRDEISTILQPDVDRLGLLCLSEKHDDILMWSHYTGGHKGFCLQFDKTIIDSSSFYNKPVYYTDKYLTFGEINDSMLDKEKQIKAVLLRKSDHWKYECEWRIIVQPHTDNTGSRSYKLPDKMLTGLIFGCEMLSEHKNIIQSFLKERTNQIKLYQAVKKESEFALEILEIE